MEDEVVSNVNYNFITVRNRCSKELEFREKR